MKKKMYVEIEKIDYLNLFVLILLVLFSFSNMMISFSVLIEETTLDVNTILISLVTYLDGIVILLLIMALPLKLKSKKKVVVKQ